MIKRKMIKLFMIGMTAMVGIGAGANAMAAQDGSYPTKPIRVVTPYSTGGTSDAVMFPFNEELSKELGVPIIYEHKPGAATNIGMEYVAKAEPDGYTILLQTYGISRNQWFGPYAPVNYMEALTPITQIMNVGGVISASNALGVEDWEDLKDKMKTENLTIGSAQADVIIKSILEAADVGEWTIVPYKGGGPALADLIAGHIDLMWGFLPAQYNAIKTGQIQPIAVTSSKRLQQIPDVKTLTEDGVDFANDAWYGLFVPTGTDDAIIKKLEGVVKKIMAMPNIQEAFAAAGAEAVVVDREKFVERIKERSKYDEEQSKKMPELVMPR